MARSGFKKGTVANPKGRPVGSKNKATEARNQLHLETIQEIEEGIKSGKLVSPLSFLMDVYLNCDNAMQYRVAAAKECMKYLHSAKPTEVRQSITTDDLGQLFELKFVPPPKDAE